MNWKDKIRDAYNWQYVQHVFAQDCPSPFTEAIWEVSQHGFDSPREIQVVIDSNDVLFMSVGSASFVDFPADMGGGMKLPLKCWIHTHPMGKAYWSGTDMKTLKVCTY